MLVQNLRVRSAACLTAANSIMFDDEIEMFKCSICTGHCEAMGKLGNRLHLRCRYCGMQSSIEVSDEEDDDEQRDSDTCSFG